MLLKCPRCRTPHEISEELEGAQFECSRCGSLFRSRRVGSPGGGKDLAAGLVGIASLVFLLLVLVLFAMRIVRSGREAPPGSPPPARAAPAAPAPGSAGPDRELVKATAAFVANVDAFNREALDRSIAFPRWYEEEGKREGKERPAYLSLAEGERAAWREALLKSLLSGKRRSELAGSDATGGAVESLGPSDARVRLDLLPRAGGEPRVEVFHLAAEEGGAWKVFAFEALVREPEKPPRLEGKKGKEPDPVRLTDGSIALEGTVEPKGHLRDTPPELQRRIDTLVAVLADPTKTKEVARARRDLVQIGRPAIPRLLNALATIPLGTEENDVVLNLVSETLTDITGYTTSFAPIAGEGSMMATSEERRRSGLRQWFGWWDRNAATFTTRPEDPDAQDPFGTGRPKRPPSKRP
jgi:hypothetical protein